MHESTAINRVIKLLVKHITVSFLEENIALLF